MFRAKKKARCEACGESPIPHHLTYFSVVMDSALSPLIPASGSQNPVSRMMSRVERATGPYFFKFLTSIGAAKKIATPDERTSLLGKVVWAEAIARAIPMWEVRIFGLPRNLYFAILPSGEEITFEGIPLPASEIDRVSWMDDKGRLKQEFTRAGLPVARGKAFFSYAKAKEYFKKLNTVCITKPSAGSGSRHTTLHIQNEHDLAHGFKLAKQIAPVIVVEEELSGPVHRVTVVGGKFVAALRRYWPRVKGDGKRTVAELVDKENKNPLRDGPYFAKIRRTQGTTSELLRQGLYWESIPKKGQDVRLHQKMNWVVGGTTEDVTDAVHPDNIELFETAAKLLKAPIAGIDFIVDDISRSWKEQARCGILECNSMPFIEVHHLPFAGEVQNVAGKVWDQVTQEVSTAPMLEDLQLTPHW